MHLPYACVMVSWRCHRQPYKNVLPLPEIEVARDLSILRNTR